MRAHTTSEREGTEWQSDRSTARYACRVCGATFESLGAIRVHAILDERRPASPDERRPVPRRGRGRPGATEPGPDGSGAR
jgi:hypothetical protein